MRSIAAVALLAASAAAYDEFVESIHYRPSHFESVNSVASNLALPKSAIAHGTYVLFDETFTFAEDGQWTVLQFDESTSISESDVDGCTLKIWSTEDEMPQLLNAHTIKQWDFKSAEFTGNEVRVQVLCAGDAQEANVSVAINGAEVGEPDIHHQETLCSNTDRREATSHNANARYVPGGSCTGWIYNDNSEMCFMTAGHCSGVGRMEFNVPLSGSVSPNDQYSIDSSSIQAANGGVGNDWKYYGGFPNSNHGQTAYEQQNQAYTDRTDECNNPTHLSHTGYGSASTSLSLRQKGQPGGSNEVQRQTNSLRYRFDTTGGDSGSPVSVGNDPTPTVGGTCGIHTHGGCTPTGGSNAGTWLGHPNVQNALRNPAGVCSTEGAKAAKALRYGIHFRGDANAMGPCVFDCPITK